MTVAYRITLLTSAGRFFNCLSNMSSSLLAIWLTTCAGPLNFRVFSQICLTSATTSLTLLYVPLLSSHFASLLLSLGGPRGSLASSLCSTVPKSIGFVMIWA